MSHLLQMRGLKHIQLIFNVTLLLVASFTDAWIETIIARVARALALSHLLQMRGLKLASGYDAKLRESRIFYRCVD